MAKKQLSGTCTICQAKIGKTAAKKHLQICAKKREMDKKPHVKEASSKAYHVLAEGYGISGDGYWMHLKIPGNATFKNLDAFLRKTWLECCGHMSTFQMGKRDVSMGWKIGDIFQPGLKLSHIYDFGDTTQLNIAFVDEFEWIHGKGKIEIMARNDDPQLKCISCGKPPIYVCPSCAYDMEAWFCESCSEEHDCGLEMLLPVVNSPRMGFCGYIG